MYHGWGYGYHIGASIDGAGARSIEEAIVPVPGIGIFYSGLMCSRRWHKQFALRLTAVIVKMQSGQAEHMSAQRDAYYPPK